ncbi:23957_t:CDS:1, partial [Gigaspora margarita]
SKNDDKSCQEVQKQNNKTTPVKASRNDTKSDEKQQFENSKSDDTEATKSPEAMKLPK